MAEHKPGTRQRKTVSAGLGDELVPEVRGKDQRGARKIRSPIEPGSPAA